MTPRPGTSLLPLLLCVTAVLAASSPARADAPPTAGDVENCTLEKQRHDGEDCEWCRAYAGGGGSRTSSQTPVWVTAQALVDRVLTQTRPAEHES